MTVARGFGLNGKSFYSNVCKPCEVNLQFTVTATNGLGVTSLKSNGYVRNVFMHTSTTPTANDGYTNPNPAAGFALIQLKQNFNKFLGMRYQIQSPNSGSDVKIDNSAMTAGQAYVITTLGNATAAKWVAIGLPVGVTAAVGVSFIATGTGGAGNTLTSRVQVPSISGVSSMEIVGSPDLSTSANISPNGGQWVLAQFLAPSFSGSALGTHTHDLLLKDAAVADGATTRVNAGANLLGANTGSNITVTGSGANGGIVAASAGTPAGTIAYAKAAPTAATIVQMKLYFDGSSVTVDGL